MLKDIIKYEDKEYQLSGIKTNNVFEIMVFPIENEIINNNEVYCFRTPRIEQLEYKYRDILYYPEKYLTKKAIEKYLACRDCYEWCCTMCKYFE